MKTERPDACRRALTLVVVLGAAAGVVAASACSGQTDSSSSAAAACAAYFDAKVAYVRRCGVLPFGNYPSDDAVAHDRERYSAACKVRFSDPHATHYGEMLASCTQELGSKPCGIVDPSSLDGVPSCSVNPTGDLPGGATCGIGDQCQGGFCGQVQSKGSCGYYPGPCSPSFICGQCESADPGPPPPGPGEPCVPWGTPCRKGLECTGYAGAGTDGTCTLPPGTCGTDEDCNAGSYCDARGQSPPTCAPFASLGESCANQVRCAQGLVCGSDIVCVNPVGVGLGEPCDNVHRCTIGNCVYAGLDGSAGPSPPSCRAPIPDGAPCGVNSADPANTCDHYSACIDGVCAFPQSRCRAR